MLRTLYKVCNCSFLIPGLCCGARDTSLPPSWSAGSFQTCFFRWEGETTISGIKSLHFIHVLLELLIYALSPEWLWEAKLTKNIYCVRSSRHKSIAIRALLLAKAMCGKPPFRLLPLTPLWEKKSFFLRCRGFHCSQEFRIAQKHSHGSNLWKPTKCTPLLEKYHIKISNNDCFFALDDMVLALIWFLKILVGNRDFFFRELCRIFLFSFSGSDPQQGAQPHQGLLKPSAGKRAI